MLRVQQTLLKKLEKVNQTRKVVIFDDYFEFDFTITYERGYTNRLIIKGEKSKKKLGERGKSKVNIDMKVADWKEFLLDSKGGFKLKTYFINDKNEKILFGPNLFLDYAIEEIRKYETKNNG